MMCCRLARRRHVHLDGLGVEIVGVALEGVARLVLGVDAVLPEDARAGGVDAGAEHRPRAHHVGVRQHLGVAGLRVARGGDAVGEVRQVRPHVGAVQLAARAQVRVGVDEAGDDGAPRQVDDGGPGRHVHLAARPHRLDARPAHHDVGVVDDLLAVHSDGARAAQHGHAFRQVARRVDDHPHLGGPELGLFVGVLSLVPLVGIVGGAGRVLIRPGAHIVRVVARSRVCGTVLLRRPVVSRLVPCFRLCLPALLERPRLVEVVREPGVAQRPVDRPPVRAPRRELAPQVGQPPGRERRVLGVRHVDGGGGAERRDGHRVDVALQLDQGLIPARGHHDARRPQPIGRAGRGRALDLHVLLLVRAVPADRHQRVGRLEQVDAVRPGREMRPGPPVGGGDQRRRRPVVARRVGGDPDDLSDV